MKLYSILLLFNFVAVNKVFGSNILFYHTMATSSHRTSIWPLASKLADAGHNVTYIFPVTTRVGSHPKIEEIIPSKCVPLLDELTDFDINTRLNNQLNEWMKHLLYKSIDICRAFYDSPEIVEWLARPGLSYDLIFIDASLGECGYGLVHKFQAKHILFTPIVVNFLMDSFGMVPESGSVPDFFYHPKPTDMTFLNRMANTMITLLWRYNYVKVIEQLEPVMQEILNVTNFPPLIEFERNTSLMFVNSHFVEEYPISMPPFFVPFSGLWCNKDMKQKQLPAKLASFIEESDTFIYVSLGSAVKSSTMPASLLEEFLNAFRSFPSIKFFWRWNGEVPKNTPENVMLMPWFPQQDILAHPKIKGFITQAGRPSSQEALCNAVPLLAIPIFGDQDYNADRLEQIGVAIQLSIENVTESSLRWGIKELLYNPNLKDRMTKMSAMFKDRPQNPLENAVYWTEYALRHDTELLKPLGRHQTWYQRRLLDVYGALLLAAITLLSIVAFSVVFVVRYSLRMLSGPKIKSD